MIASVYTRVYNSVHVGTQLYTHVYTKEDTVSVQAKEQQAGKNEAERTVRGDKGSTYIHTHLVHGHAPTYII